MEQKPISIVMLGATGAVGGQVLQTLLQQKNVAKVTTFGRRHVEGIDPKTMAVQQHKVDIFDPDVYEGLIEGHSVAICTLGVGEPSKISKEDFERIDKTAVLDFAHACKKAGVRHFQLLSSVSVDPKSSMYYLRIKGELNAALASLNFERLSIFQPSMILTPTNRYGLMQAITLAVWPLLNPILAGGTRKYRGIKVEKLGAAMALNSFRKGDGDEILQWDDFMEITNS